MRAAGQHALTLGDKILIPAAIELRAQRHAELRAGELVEPRDVPQLVGLHDDDIVALEERESFVPEGHD